MSYRPYQSDWQPAYEARLGVRLQWFGRYAGYPEWSVETSRLAADKISFFFVEKERCWSVINGVRHEAQAGELLVFRGGDEFCSGHDPERPHVSLSAALAIDTEGIANRLLQFEFQRKYRLKDPALYVREFERVLAFFKEHRSSLEVPAVPPVLRPEYEALPHRDILFTGVILNWVSRVIEMLQPRLTAEAVGEVAPIDRVLAAEAWALEHLREEITLRAWADGVGVSRDYLGRIFRRHTGKRPMEWLNEQRLRQAEQLLTSTTKPLVEIAEACGFTCPFYLSRLFKRQFGLAPGAYRKIHRG